MRHGSLRAVDLGSLVVLSLVAALVFLKKKLLCSPSLSRAVVDPGSLANGVVPWGVVVSWDVVAQVRSRSGE